jgi:DNA-binding response OmpR family regulator
MCETNDRMPKRILVIDDDIDLLMLLERCLQKEGFTVETAASLHEAEDIIGYFDPHLVLLDINVKGEDGRQLCWKLKNTDNAAAVKVIIISGYDYSTGRALLFGADDLLAKPLQTDYLLHRIDLHLMANGYKANAMVPPFSDTEHKDEEFPGF